MSLLKIPNPSSSIWEYEKIDAQVWIAGARRADAVCTGFSTSDNQSYGTATIWFPNAAYDAEMCLENDLVEIKIDPYGTVWRGYIITRESNNDNQLTYKACDLLAKFDDCFFWEHEYCYQDEVTTEYRYEYTIKQIAADAYNLYLGWKTGNCDDDFLLSIDLDSFPDVYPNETKVLDQPLLQGLLTILGSIDYRYHIKIEHTEIESTIKAYILGEGTEKAINRGYDPESSYMAQPGGPSLVIDISKTVEAKDSLSHVLAQGDNRIVETAFNLSQAWNLVPDNFTPPAGSTLKDYVTQSEMALVINNWEKYSKEQIDMKSYDKTKVKNENPNYRKKFENVCCRYAIPKIDTRWTYMDQSANTSPVYGESNTQVKLESTLVQLYNNTEQDPFIVYKRLDDPNLYVKQDGFSIQNSQFVKFSEPFVDTVTWKRCGGNHGVYVAGSWSDSNGTSRYDVTKDPFPANTITTEMCTSNGNPSMWLFLGESLGVYEITNVDGYILTVKGNLDGAGVPKPMQEGDVRQEYEEGADWVVVNNNPYITVVNNSGVGLTDGRYQISTSGSETLNNKYAGMYLVLGDFDFSSKLCWLTKPKELKSYKIAYNSDKYITVENPDTDLTGSPADYAIITTHFETKRPYEWLALNAAYKAPQRLMWFSGDLGTLQNKRIIPKNNNDYKWKTQSNNYTLVKSTVSGEEDKCNVVFNTQKIDSVNEQAYLAAWASNQINGANTYAVNYSVSLGLFDFNLGVGDRIIDTQMDSGATITSISYDLENVKQMVTATSWS